VLSILPIRDSFLASAEAIAIGLEAVAVFIIVIGATLSTVAFTRALLLRSPFEDAAHAYRNTLGSTILVGLELLVAADIVGTVVVAPTFTNVGVLALIIAVRTFLSFALEVEINGHWPWQRTSLVGEVSRTSSP
jgi:uncharacterized membrane protein